MAKYNNFRLPLLQSSTKGGGNRLEIVVPKTASSNVLVDLNIIRQTIFTKVGTIAINEASIRRNNSSMQDQIIVHIVTSLPLSYDRATSLPGCKTPLLEVCRNCDECMVKFALDISGPRVVMSGDLQRIQGDNTVKIIPNIPLFELKEYESIIAEFYARWGDGSINARFYPVTVAYVQPRDYDYLFIIEVIDTGVSSPETIYNEALDYLEQPISS